MNDIRVQTICHVNCWFKRETNMDDWPILKQTDRKKSSRGGLLLKCKTTEVSAPDILTFYLMIVKTVSTTSEISIEWRCGC